MPRVSPILRQCEKAIKDLELRKILQSEIRYEQSLKRFQNDQNGSLGDFTVGWDSERSQDVFLRRKCESGEEVVVSAILGPTPSYIRSDVYFPRDVLMKVCLKKPGLSSVLQFDCKVFENHDRQSQFDVYDAHYLPSLTSLGLSNYRGPLFSTLDRRLQEAFKEYLVAKGIGEELTSFLLLHLHKKEQGQYVKWLRDLQSFLSRNE